MRHINRVHGVSAVELYERFSDPHFRLVYEKSEWQAADIYTKNFDSKEKWQYALSNARRG